MGVPGLISCARQMPARVVALEITKDPAMVIGPLAPRVQAEWMISGCPASANTIMDSIISLAYCNGDRESTREIITGSSILPQIISASLRESLAAASETELPMMGLSVKTMVAGRMSRWAVAGETSLGCTTIELLKSRCFEV